MNNQKITSPVMVSAGFLSALLSLFVLINLVWGYQLALYILVAVCALGLSFIYPIAGLLAVTFLTLVWSQHFTLSPLIINQTEYKIYLIDWFLVAIYFRTALDWLRQAKPHWNWADRLLVVFFAWVALVFALSIAFWDASLASAVSSLKNYTFYPILFFVAWYYGRERATVRAWLEFLIAGALASVLFFVYGLVAGQGLWTEITPLSTEGARFLDFNHAFYLCLATIVGLAYIIRQRDALARQLAWLLPLFVAGIVGSLMRHLWLALVVYLVWFLISLGNDRASFKKLIAKYTAVVVMIVTVVAMIWAIAPQSQLAQKINDQQGYLATRVLSLFDDGDTSIAWRSTLWQTAVSNLAERPWMGLGLGQKVFIDMGSYKDYVELRNIHNSFLAILTQLGVLGIALLALFVLHWFYRVWMTKSNNSLALVIRYSTLGVVIFCLVAFLFQPYLEANFFSVWWWIFLGLGRAYYEGSLS